MSTSITTLASGTLTEVVPLSAAQTWFAYRKNLLDQALCKACGPEGNVRSEFTEREIADAENCKDGEVRVELEFRYWCE